MKIYSPRFKNILATLILLMTIPFFAIAQENSKATKAQKKADKKKQEQIEKERKAEIKGKKFHNKIQDKATRKRMKKHRKRVDRGYPSGKPGFFKRIFGMEDSTPYREEKYAFNNGDYFLTVEQDFKKHRET